LDFAELLHESLRALRAHALRSLLTLLGIIIGVATLVGVVSVISGLNVFVRERVIQLAPDVYVVTKFGIITGRDEFLDALRRPDLQWRDYEHLNTRLRLAEAVAAQASGTSAVKFRERRLPDISILGTTANLASLAQLDIVAGRYFTPAEDGRAQPLAVIGWDVKDELYPHLDPVGRTLLVGGAPYTIIGVLEKQGRTLGQSRDSQVYIPYQAYRRQFGSRSSLDFLVRARGGVPGVAASADEVRALLRAVRHASFRAPDPFGIVTAEQLQQLWRQISAAAFILSLLIASVSLGVGGIVIMNIMLVAVVERTQEIGMRMAVGAKKRDIRRQFLLEAALLSLAGGFVGVLLGALVAVGVRELLSFPTSVTFEVVVAGLALSAVVGVLAGYWPARNASNLLVVEALRAE